MSSYHQSEWSSNVNKHWVSPANRSKNRKKSTERWQLCRFSASTKDICQDRTTLTTTKQQHNSTGTFFHNLLLLLLITFSFTLLLLLTFLSVSCYFIARCIFIYSLHSLQHSKHIIELYPTGHLISQSHIHYFFWESFTSSCCTQ